MCWIYARQEKNLTSQFYLYFFLRHVHTRQVFFYAIGRFSITNTGIWEFSDEKKKIDTLIFFIILFRSPTRQKQSCRDPSSVEYNFCGLERNYGFLYESTNQSKCVFFIKYDAFQCNLIIDIDGFKLSTLNFPIFCLNECWCFCDMNLLITTYVFTPPMLIHGRPTYITFNSWPLPKNPSWRNSLENHLRIECWLTLMSFWKKSTR